MVGFEYRRRAVAGQSDQAVSDAAWGSAQSYSRVNHRQAHRHGVL